MPCSSACSSSGSPSGAEASLGSRIPESSVNGFHYFFQGTIPWLIAIAILVLLVLRKFFAEDVNLPDQAGSLTWSQVYLIASGVAAVLVLLRLLTGDSGADRKFGLWLTSLGVIAMVVGAFLKFQAKEDDAHGRRSWHHASHAFLIEARS